MLFLNFGNTNFLFMTRLRAAIPRPRRAKASNALALAHRCCGHSCIGDDPRRGSRCSTGAAHSGTTRSFFHFHSPMHPGTGAAVQGRTAAGTSPTLVRLLGCAFAGKFRDLSTVHATAEHWRASRTQAPRPRLRLRAPGRRSIGGPGETDSSPFIWRGVFVWGGVQG